MLAAALLPVREGKGRSCRKEIWIFAAFIWVMSTAMTGLFSSGSLAVIPGLFSLAVLVPMYALMVRRLHDPGFVGVVGARPLCAGGGGRGSDCRSDGVGYLERAGSVRPFARGGHHSPSGCGSPAGHHVRSLASPSSSCR
ncbi:DUF805 domain-containing protein [Bifidobacterium sp. B4081]|nr:DUF805 domain-containing protein [Bifidobacterium sp. B4077]MCX8646712.1 DUF805 domain-containing protein [Bifidobacterium sp. B4081]MCX8668497.1 DUF805 domain-containing protein [Bifidobacterium sp. B3998]